jgi:two-component system sensor histidine kinase RegB
VTTTDATTAPRGDAPSLAADSAPELVLRGLVPLRFAAASGYAAMLLAAQLGLHLPLPYAALWAVPVVSFVSSFALQRIAARGTPPARRVVPAVLLFDVLVFTFLIQASGGPDNPLSALYAIPVAMAAMTGSAGATWAVAASAAAGYALVFAWHETQHFWHGPLYEGAGVGLHAVGMWFAVVVVSVVITSFLGRITRTLRAREAEIQRLGHVAERSARLASLTTLAAGAAHELGSPLGTIAVVAREIERRAAGASDALGDDARLLRAEVSRCRSILDRMLAQAERAQGDPGDELRAGEALAALGEGLGESGAPSRVAGEIRAPAAASLGSRLDFVEMVVPLLRNALDASPREAPVQLVAELEGSRLRVRIRDQGPGMDAATLARAGEPFFTTRPPGRGTGLGLFVVRLNAERLGGTLRLDSAPGRGTTATLEWPLPGSSSEGGLRGA